VELDTLPPMAAERGSEDPLARLKAHARNTQHRILVLAESDGRRESLLDFLRASGVNPPVFDSLLDFQTSDEKFGIATAALSIGFSWLETAMATGLSDLVDFETELFASAPTTRKRKKQEQVSDVEALIKDLSELNVGDPVVHSQHGIGRYRGPDPPGFGQQAGQWRARDARIFAPGIRRQGHAVCAGQPVAADQPLHRRQRR
jgi:transcription-repair coupling factor (superfamily II helicase)